MKKVYLLLFTLSLLSTAQAASQTTKHTIKNGETLFTIARANHTTIEEVRKFNGLKKGETLKIGRILTVPKDTYSPNKKTIKKKSVAKTTKHTIKSGETLFIIARANHTTIDAVRKANGLKKGDRLKVGRVLTVPKDTYSRNNKTDKKVAKKAIVKKPTVKLAKHTIKSGETLFIIARANHTTINAVRKANGLKKGDRLKIGRVLTVPKDTYSPNKKTNKKVAKKAVVKKPTVKFSKHTIKSGETLFTIARANNTTIKEVRKFNGLKKSETLKIGRVLKVPTNTYNVPKTKVAKANVVKKKKVKVARVTKKSNKKLAASLASLETIPLEKNKVIKHKKKKSNSFALTDIFFSSKNADSTKSAKITSIAKDKLGRRYVWGATGTKNTFDCSGFTKYVYKKNGIDIPRTSINQSKHGKYVSRANLKKGDLIFFDTSKKRKGYVNHVGIYLGNGKFIHASSAKKKVVVSNLSKFYGKRYKGARRPS